LKVKRWATDSTTWFLPRKNISVGEAPVSYLKVDTEENQKTLGQDSG